MEESSRGSCSFRCRTAALMLDRQVAGRGLLLFGDDLCGLSRGSDPVLSIAGFQTCVFQGSNPWQAEDFRLWRLVACLFYLLLGRFELFVFTGTESWRARCEGRAVPRFLSAITERPQSAPTTRDHLGCSDAACSPA